MNTEVTHTYRYRGIPLQGDKFTAAVYSKLMLMYAMEWGVKRIYTLNETTLGEFSHSASYLYIVHNDDNPKNGYTDDTYYIIEASGFHSLHAMRTAVIERVESLTS